MAQSRLQAIDVTEVAPSDSPREPHQNLIGKLPISRTESALGSLLAISLKSLSQRALVAVASLVDLALIGSAFVLWLNVMAQPSVLQLVGVGMYSAFILIAIYSRNR